MALEKLKRGDFINFLVYKMFYRKLEHKKRTPQIRSNLLRSINDFQRLLGDNSNLGPTVGITPD